MLKLCVSLNRTFFIKQCQTNSPTMIETFFQAPTSKEFGENI